jgi:hypothetical protein
MREWGDGVSGKADGVVRQRRIPVGRSSVGRSVVSGSIGTIAAGRDVTVVTGR